MIALYIILAIIAVFLIIFGVMFWIATDTYKVISVEGKRSKWKLIIVNRFGNKKEWILSKSSEYGERISEGSFGIGSEFSKSSLHGGYKGFIDLGKDKDLWNNY